MSSNSMIFKMPNKPALRAQAKVSGSFAVLAWLFVVVASIAHLQDDYVLAGIIAAGVLSAVLAALSLALRPRGLSRRATLITTLVLLVVGANAPLIARATDQWLAILAITFAGAAALVTSGFFRKAPEES